MMPGSRRGSRNPVQSNILAPLLSASDEAWRQVKQQRHLATLADDEVERALRGRRVIISGRSHGEICGGSLLNRRIYFHEALGTITDVFFYEAVEGPRREIFRARLANGETWEFSIRTTQVAPAP